MPILIADCPRCNIKRVTFDAFNIVFVENDDAPGWKGHEMFCNCRSCHRSTVFYVKPRTEHSWLFTDFHAFSGPINDIIHLLGYVSQRDHAVETCPDHVPPSIAALFDEACVCKATQCWTASAAMFRRCIAVATEERLTEEARSRVKADLFSRVAALKQQNAISDALVELALCVRDELTPGSETEADDLLDFTRALLINLFTEPGRLEEAKVRRQQRRAV